jgi:hypothetical protein
LWNETKRRLGDGEEGFMVNDLGVYAFNFLIFFNINCYLFYNKKSLTHFTKKNKKI